MGVFSYCVISAVIVHLKDPKGLLIFFRVIQHNTHYTRIEGTYVLELLQFRS
uniref:Uncharacterized protein n=1 Tax=Lepeophtheirus salmonis TaxID=72036 RepID=A0A0K2TWE2_LEPSM